MDTRMLKSAIFSNYRTIADFLADMGWTRSKMGRLMSGEYLPNVEEAAAISERLHLQPEEFLKIFYPSYPQTGIKE